MSSEVIKPQKGFQMDFLSCSADIAIGGSAAGVGKSFAELLEPLYHKNVKGFTAMTFRRTTVQIRNPGGLWDKSREIYTRFGGKAREQQLDWVWPSGAVAKFSHLEHESNMYDHQGSEYCLIQFDELTHFSKKMFFYLLTRNRSTCGVKPYMRATCNPDPESWVAELVAWWVNQETGLPIPERIGVLRYMVIDGEKYIWGDSKQQVYELARHIIDDAVNRSDGSVSPDDFIKSVTFISGSIYDNRELLRVDPGYLANLFSQDEATKKSLLDGNWKISLSNLDLYNYPAFYEMFYSYDQTKGRPTVKPIRKKSITADIALEGSNKLVVGYWEDFELMDIEVMDKSDGPQVVQLIESVRDYYSVPNHRIVFDADGVGGFIEGYIPGAIAFHGGATPYDLFDEITGKTTKENYFNLKTQCFYRSAKRVLIGETKVNPHVWEKRYDKDMTIKERFLYERRAIKKDKVDSDGKLRLIGKADMKLKLNGQSPDLMDMFSMIEALEMIPERPFGDAEY